MENNIFIDSISNNITFLKFIDEIGNNNFINYFSIDKKSVNIGIKPKNYYDYSSSVSEPLQNYTSFSSGSYLLGKSVSNFNLTCFSSSLGIRMF
jgi:hypothetical protein